MAKTTEFKRSRVVREATVTLTYEDHTDPVKLLTLPKGSRLIGFALNVKTAFSGGTGQELNIGVQGDPDAIVDGASLATAGQVSLTTEVVQPGYETEAMEAIYAQVGDAANTAGEADLTVLFSVGKLTRI